MIPRRFATLTWPVIAGFLGLVIWIVLSYGDAESGPEPLIGWQPFDDWIHVGSWKFIAAVLVWGLRRMLLSRVRP